MIGANFFGFVAYYNHARGKEDVAKGYYEKALQGGMNKTKYITAYGVLCMRQGEFDKAIKLFTKAMRVKLKPQERNSIRTSRAIAYLKSGDHATARAALEELHEKYRSLRVYQALGYYYTITEDEKAQTYLREALDYEPQDVVTLDNLGQYHIGKKEYEKARTYLEKAYDISQDKVDILYHLAQVEQAAGNIDKAREYIDKAGECKISALNDATQEKIAVLRVALTPQESE